MSFQLIDNEGIFQGARLNEFVTANKLGEIGPSYAIVATIGPIGSGKSTLLNRLFDTSFREMDASSGRSKTTRGVWLARATKVEPCLLVMDLEGTDAIERKGDTAFEWQTALLALAVSDIVLINIWGSDIGRENGASVPLLRLVFQAFMTKFRSLKNKMKTTLLLVIHDSLKSTPVKSLEAQLIEGFYKIWESVKASSSNDNLTDYFNVKVIALPHYELERKVFDDEVNALRQRFRTSMAQRGTQKDLLESRRAAVLGTGLSDTTSFIWETIKLNKSLDLLSLQVTISNTRLSEIVKNKSVEFRSHQGWNEISTSAKNGDVAGFGSKVHQLLSKQISSYDEESSHFDEKTKTSYRTLLEKEARENVQPVYQQILSQHRDKAIKTFERELRDWASSSTTEVIFAVAVRQYKRKILNSFEKSLADSRVYFVDHEREESKSREEILRKIDVLVSSVREEKTRAIFSSGKKELESDLVEFIRTSFKSASHDTWFTVRNQLEQVVQSAQSSLRFRLTAYELDKTTQNSFSRQLNTFGREIVKAEAKREASQAIQRMRERFQTIFNRFNPDESTKREGLIQTVAEGEILAEQALSSALNTLAVLAVIRLDDKAYEVVEQTLATLLLDHRELTSKTELTARSWPGIPLEQTLLNPTQCFNIWREFYSGAEGIIKKTLAPLHAQNLDIINSTEGNSVEHEDISSQHSRLSEIVKQKLFEYKSDQEWNEITNSAKTGATPGLGKKVQNLFLKYISSFEQESSNVDEKTRLSYQVILEKEAREIVLPIYQQTLLQHYETAITTFERELRDWASSPTSEVIFPVAVRQLKRKVLATFAKSLTDTQVDYIDHESEESKFREELLRKIDVLVISVRDEKAQALVSSQKEELESVFEEFTRKLLKSATYDTWSKVRHRLEEVVQSAQSSLRFRLTAYELDETTQNSFFEQLETFGRVIVIKEAKEEASQAIHYMNERFESIFGGFNQGVLKKHQDPIETIAEGEILAHKARSSALKVLSVLAVIRLHEKAASDPVDQILSALLRGREITASSWQGIPSEQTLLTPLQCSKIWTEFLSGTNPSVEQALAPLQGALPQKDGPDHTLLDGLQNDRPDYTHSGGAQNDAISTAVGLEQGGLPQRDAIGSTTDHQFYNGPLKDEIPVAVRLGKASLPQKDGSDVTRFNGPQIDGSDYTRFNGPQQYGSHYTRNGPQEDEISAVVRLGKGTPIDQFNYAQEKELEDKSSHALASSSRR